MSNFCETEYGFDYIFGRMSAIYGNDFARKWDGIDANLIRQEWINTLGSFLTYRPSMDYALAHIDPARPPSSLQFRKIFQDGPAIPPKDPLTQIGALSVISKESNFRPKSEVSYANTSNSRIRKIFGSRVSKYSDSEMDSLKKNPEKFFNVVYAKTVGNQGGGDGWKYRGRGFNQLTGKKNYEKYGNMIGRNLVGNPDLANDPTVAAEIAVAFFTKGKPGNTFPKFKNKTEAATHFADINSGGGVSSHRANAIAAVDKFDIKDIT
jgi:predicted chitinase